MKLRLFLKFYLALYALLNLSGFYANLTTRNVPVFEIFRAFVFFVFAALGVFLYTVQKKWFSGIFWKCFFLLFMADQLYELEFMIRNQNGIPVKIVVISWFITILLCVPIYWGVFRYAFDDSGESK